MIRSCLTALGASAVLALAAATAAPASNTVQYYVSLGDSLAQGYQPIGGPTSFNVLPIHGYNQGYADQLFRLVRNSYPQLRHVNFGCGGTGR